MAGKEGQQQAWEARYQQGKTAWNRGEVSPALHHWLDHGALPQGRVLVPGCGHGHEVAALLRAGCSVTAVDIAAQPVQHLRQQLAEQGLQAEVIQADLLQWQPTEPFDAIYEQTCLCALDPSHWRDYEQRLAAWLLPGAPLLALFMQTGKEGGPPFDCPLPEMRELFDPVRWDWPDAPMLDVPHPNLFVEKGILLRRR